MARAAVCTVRTLPSSNCMLITSSGRGFQLKRVSSASTSSWRKPTAIATSSTPAFFSIRKCRSSSVMPSKRNRHFGSWLSSGNCRRTPRPAAKMIARIKILSSSVRDSNSRRSGADGGTEGARGKTQVQQSRQAQQQFTCALCQRQCQCRVGQQACQRSEQQITAFLHTQGTRDRKARAANRLTQTLEQQSNQIDLARAGDPTDQAEQEAHRDGAVTPISPLHGKIDGLRLGDPPRPVALARKAPHRAYELAEHSAPLDQIKPAHLHRQKAARNQHRRAQRPG